MARKSLTGEGESKKLYFRTSSEVNAILKKVNNKSDFIRKAIERYEENILTGSFLMSLLEKVVFFLNNDLVARSIPRTIRKSFLNSLSSEEHDVIQNLGYISNKKSFFKQNFLTKEEIEYSVSLNDTYLDILEYLAINYESQGIKIIGKGEQNHFAKDLAKLTAFLHEDSAYEEMHRARILKKTRSPNIWQLRKIREKR